VNSRPRVVDSECCANTSLLLSSVGIYCRATGSGTLPHLRQPVNGQAGADQSPLVLNGGERELPTD